MKPPVIATGMLKTIGWNYLNRKKQCKEFVVPFSHIQYITEGKDETSLLVLYEKSDERISNVILTVDVSIDRMMEIWKHHLQNPTLDITTHEEF